MSKSFYKSVTKALIFPTSLMTGVTYAESPQNDLVYQIFVRSFYDANPDSTGVGDIKGITRWFTPRFDQANDGVSKEEQEGEGGLLHLVHGLTTLRTGHPSLANGDIGAILTDSEEWLVFEKVMGSDNYLVLINQTPNGMNYRFHRGWFPEYSKSQLIFWSAGKAKAWRDTTMDNEMIDSDAFVPPFGMVILRRR
ncbi:MAG: hypothetical protein ACE5G1_13320 [bacterium]